MGAKFPTILFLHVVLLASSAGAETVHFRNATWPPTPLQLSRAASGQTIAEQASMRLAGELHTPRGRGPFPAIVRLNDCSGRLPHSLADAERERYLALGYALLVVDSLGPRGITDGCTGPGLSVDTVMDAYGALLYLAGLHDIDRNRIALVGHGEGAVTALVAVAFDGVERLFDIRFRAAVAYSPLCLGRDGAVAVPTLVLIGERDEWAPVRYCREMMARRSGLGAPLRLVVYPEAYHAFNEAREPRSFYGYRLEYDQAADRAAWAETVELLRQAFGR
jgi:dienelactone hydrolase